MDVIDMRAADLMIGDYLMYNNMPYRVIQIEDVLHEGWMLENGVEDCGKPIPLTREILENNGFYYGYTSNEEDLASNTIAQLSEEDKGWVWDEGAGQVKVIFPNESDGGEIQICDQSFDRSMSFIFTENMMLHEFQNLLTICRIKKEIVL